MNSDRSDARQQLLTAVEAATEGLARAMAYLTEAFEQLDEQHADQLEAALFRPLQRAYGRAQRACAEYAQRNAVAVGEHVQPPQPAPSIGAKGLVDGAVETLGEIEGELVMLQDSLMLIELGDPEFRAALAEVRQVLADVTRAARAFLRTLGR
ncbi:MAG: hypothetical protein ACYDA6_01995 [Solirubrobacteraceae bacterium]